MLLIEKLTYDVKTTKILLANKMNRKINSSCYPRPFNIHLSIYLFIPFGNLAYISLEYFLPFATNKSEKV